MNANGCDMTGAAARRSLSGSRSRSTDLFSGMFHNCFSIKSGVTVGKIKAGILGGSGGLNEAAGGSLLANSCPTDVKYLNSLALRLG